MHLAPLLIGLFTVAGAATALALRNVIHSTLLLIASWFGIAAFFLWAGAEFVAFAQLVAWATEAPEPLTTAVANVMTPNVPAASRTVLLLRIRGPLCHSGAGPEGVACG